eukprot:2310178-Pleurochrysis_carterae.AAC.1
MGHDLARRNVADRVVELASNDLCVTVFASPPCSTWSAARFKPEGQYCEPMGIPQPGGGLPATVLRANALIANCVRIAEATHTRWALCVQITGVPRQALPICDREKIRTCRHVHAP